jgi:hypothetical protein
MTSDNVRSEIDKSPFVPLRFHLVSGKTIDVPVASAAWMLQSAVLVMHEARVDDAGYDLVALRNIERIEQLDSSRK